MAWQAGTVKAGGHDRPGRQRLFHNVTRVTGLALAVAALLGGIVPVCAADTNIAELEQRIARLTRELETARRDLDEARAQQHESISAASPQRSALPDASTAPQGDASDIVVTQEGVPLVEGDPVAGVVAVPDDDEEKSDFRIGPVTIGGAIRVNYVLGSYTNGDDGPNRGGNGGNVELDTFRINLDLDYNDIIGKLEYRWYPADAGKSYNFLHTGWLGYRFDDTTHLEVGVNRVPFGPGPYGVSQSWFFDQHYYVGLADDMDLGIKYVTTYGDWNVDLAYYASSEGSFNGRSEDSARYSYDAVKWTSGTDAAGNIISAPVNGYSESNQFNARGIYSLTDTSLPTDIGLSLQYGQLEGRRTSDGSHWAASAHMVNRFDNFTLASQLTRYEIDIDDDNPWGTDALIPMGAYDFAWPAATKAWIPALSLSYKHDTPTIGWLDYVLPYVEYSSIIKDDGDFNDSQMVTLGAAWASGNWYIYSDLVYSNGNFFVGDDGDDYSNIFDGVGDFGVTGNDKWNYRFNINLGYYF